MTAITNSNLIKQHLIGKICFFDNNYSDRELACMVNWHNNKSKIFQIDVMELKKILAPFLYEKMHEDSYVMECDAFVDENNTISDIEITWLFETFNPINNQLK